MMLAAAFVWVILGTCTVIIEVCCVVSGAIQQTSICDVSNIDVRGVDSQGELVSPGYPYSAPSRERTQPLCRMTITACPECYMRLNFEEINLPSCVNGSSTSGGCILGCDHILVYDLNYPRGTIKSVFARNQGDTFVSISNRVYITFCHAVSNPNAYKRFRVTYKLMEKYTLITGEHGTSSAVGYFTSPNFPRYYALNREIYFYHLKNTNPDGFIRLGFEDWLLSPNSKMKIYFNNASSPEVYLTRNGSGDRPYVFSGGPYLYLRFETGEDTIYNHNFVGFKAKYEFVKDEYWPEKPYTVCGEYYYDLYAGEFAFDYEKCFEGDRVDCLWVVRKKRDVALFSFRSHVNLHIQDINLVEDEDTLQIRGGNNSASPLLASFGSNNLTGTEYSEEEAFYVHLTAQCNKNRRLKAVFTSFTFAQDGKCFYYYHYKCANNRCIYNQLRCDGIDHCGDSSDEENCPTKDSTKEPCVHYRRCEDGFGFYCPIEMCDRKWDCQDGSDELRCPDMVTTKTIEQSRYDFNLHTFIPVAMVTVLLAIAACVTISFCIRVKRSRQLHQNQRGGIASAIRSLMPGERRTRQSGTRVNINVEIQHYPDLPPSYNEAVRYDAYLGTCNLGYTPSDLTDVIPEPPPYTPIATEPLSKVYSLQGQGDLGWSGSGHSQGWSNDPPPNPPSYQESVRRERRRERRHSNGLYGVDPHRHPRRHTDGDQREERPRQGRHRQRRHRSHLQNRGPPTISEEIFIDTPPWSIPNNNTSNSRANNPHGVTTGLSASDLCARNPLTSPISRQTVNEQSSSANEGLSNTIEPSSRSGSQQQGSDNGTQRTHRPRSSPNEGQTSNMNDNRDNASIETGGQNIEEAANGLVNQIFLLLSQNIAAGNQTETGTNQAGDAGTSDTLFPSMEQQSQNSETHSRSHNDPVTAAGSSPKYSFDVLPNGTTQVLPVYSQSNAASNFPSVHKSGNIRQASGAIDNNANVHHNQNGQEENRPSYVYDNPVFNLPGIADDDTSV